MRTQQIKKLWTNFFQEHKYNNPQKILAKQIQHVKRITHHNQAVFILGN
jgi:hypothetical protein